MNNFTDFEKKLAEQIPQLRRDVKNEVLMSMNQPTRLPKWKIFQNTFQKKLQHHRQQSQMLQQYIAVGLCSFFLGITIISCFFLSTAAIDSLTSDAGGNGNRNLFRHTLAQINRETTEYKTTSLLVTIDFLEGVNSPIKLLQKMSYQKSVCDPQPEQTSTP
jgi:hypothetical protein